MALYLPQRWKTQPQVLCGIDWSNPLSSGIGYACYGHGYDAVENTFITLNQRKVLPPADKAFGGVAGYRVSSDKQPVTIIARHRYDSRDSTYAGMSWGFYNGASDSSQVAIALWATADTIYGVHRADGGAHLNLETSISFPYDHVWAASGLMASGGMKTYKDGIQQSTISLSGAASFSTDSQRTLRMGQSPSTDRYYPWAYKFHRQLSGDEIRELTYAPYQILKPLTARIYSFPTAAGGLSIPVAAYHYNHNIGSKL